MDVLMGRLFFYIAQYFLLYKILIVSMLKNFFKKL